MSLLDGTRLAAIDTETTGMSPASGAALVEVARVAIDGGALGETWSSLVRPGRPIPPDASAVHGITDAMVADAPPPAAVAAELRARCGELPLVFHNAPFDLPFLVALFREHGQPPLLGPIVDTLGLARGLFGAGSNSLGALAARLGLPPETSHRALGDARTTARLFLALAERWERERGTRTLAELAAASQDVLRVASRGDRIRGPVDTSAPRRNDSRLPPQRPAAPVETRMTQPQVGQIAPDFRLKGPGGAFVTLSEYLGHKHLVLAFFPLAFSPVCSHQLPEVQQALPAFEKLGAVVLGISVDSHWANEAFAHSLGVTFPLLSDFKRQAMTAYGVLLSEAGYSGRALFVIGRDGRVVYRDVPGDVDQIPSPEGALRALEALGQPA